MTNIISELFDSLSAVVNGMLDVLTSLFGGVINLFYNPATTEGGTGSFTFLGIVLLVGVGTPIVFWGLNWITGIFKRMLKR